MTAWLLANAADEGRRVITGMLITGLVFIAVIALGETSARSPPPQRLKVDGGVIADAPDQLGCIAAMAALRSRRSRALWVVTRVRTVTSSTRASA